MVWADGDRIKRNLAIYYKYATLYIFYQIVMTFKYSKSSLLKSMSVAGLIVTGMGITASYADNVDDAELDKKAVEQPDAERLEISEVPIPERTVSELIQLLSDRDYMSRQQATETLWRRGKPALQALEEAVISKHPELVSRASTIITYIKAGVSPDTPPHIADLVRGFEIADADQKLDVLRKLYAEREYSLMLFMLSELKDRKMYRDLYGEFPRLGHLAAHDSIILGNVDTAIEQLKLAPKTPTLLRSLAYLYQLTGEADAELKKLKALPGDSELKALEKYLYLVKHDRAEIRKYAEQEKLDGVIANLDLLDGDPTKMVDFLSNKAPFISKSGLAVLKAQYFGDDDGIISTAYESQLKSLMLFEGNKPTNITNQVFKSMALTGAAKKLEPYMRENYKSEAFSYFSYQEQPKLALEAIGITDEASLALYITEVTEKAVNYKKDQKADRFGKLDLENEHRQQLLMLTEFYYDRGLYAQAKSVISPLLLTYRLKKKEWNILVEQIFQEGMHDLGIDLIIANSNDDEEIFEVMVNYLYDDTHDTDLIWRKLKGRAGVSKEKSFRDLALLMGVEKEKIKPYLELQDELQKLAEKNGAAALTEMHRALLSVASYRGDAHSHVKFAKLILDNKNGDENADLILARKGEYLRALTGTVDSKTMTEFIDANSNVIERSARWYGIYSIAQRNLGDEAAADKLLAHAKLLTMGLYDGLREIAAEHYIAGYHDISTEIMEQCLISASLDRNDYTYESILGYLSSGDNVYIHKKQWGKAAAVLMVNAINKLTADPSAEEISDIGIYSNTFYNFSFTRGMELYQKGEKVKGLKMLKSAHEALIGNGTLADHFYPVIRTLDLKDQYDVWVEESYQYLSKAIVEFPDSANTHNTMAWLLSRANRRLDDALMHSEKSHELNPFEPAYIDTMGEVWHAKGDREKAVAWGEKAVSASMYGRLDAVGASTNAKLRTYSLNNQLKRFRSEAHPKP